MTQPDSWSEVAWVSIAKQSGTDVIFQTLTETVDIDIGDKDFDVIATLAGGRLVKFTPQEPTTITLEAYPTEAGSIGFATAVTGGGFWDLFTTFQTYAAADLISLPTDRNRNKFRIAILWTDATSVTNGAAGQVASPANAALRVAASDGYFTSVKPSFTDGVLKFTVTYKVPPFDKNGTGNVVVQSIDGVSTATLSALTSYTSTVKGW